MIERGFRNQIYMDQNRNRKQRSWPAFCGMTRTWCGAKIRLQRNWSPFDRTSMEAERRRVTPMP